MKTLSVILISAVAVLSGCVAYDGPHADTQSSTDGRYYNDRDRNRDYYGDRDRDGVRDSEDRRPNNPRRY